MCYNRTVTLRFLVNGKEKPRNTWRNSTTRIYSFKQELQEQLKIKMMLIYFKTRQISDRKNLQNRKKKSKKSMELQEGIDSGSEEMKQQIESEVGKSKKQKLNDKIKARKKQKLDALNQEKQQQEHIEKNLTGTKKTVDDNQETNLIGGGKFDKTEGNSKTARTKKLSRSEQQKKKDKIVDKQQKNKQENKKDKQIEKSQAKTEKSEPKSKFFVKLEKQLMGGRFRWLNEQLYTINSKAAFEMMQENEEYFNHYHEGFRTQIAQWPVQPINQAIEFVKRKSSDFVVVDFGCGEAQLADSVPNSKVHSIDLVSDNPKVISCDMANTPLENESCDVAIFCLALMGINYGDFLQEAKRVLKCRGWLWIAEVRSRFDKDKKLKPFVEGIESLGFQLMQKDLTSTHFVVFVFKKKAKLQGKAKKVQWPELKACQYKRR
eukprot:TRINITY_DN9566_c0_g2_i1.p1 TRINITY_DN9566_c0_g2~~TRINITY_DN9566_c0_g2_i1.p1  ORF type:complete len:433 (+),score=63.42 TRINITY_DN9566_c0_g2_i1:205-1503(+)